MDAKRVTVPLANEKRRSRDPARGSLKSRDEFDRTGGISQECFRDLPHEGSVGQHFYGINRKKLRDHRFQQTEETTWPRFIRLLRLNIKFHWEVNNITIEIYLYYYDDSPLSSDFIGPRPDAPPFFTAECKSEAIRRRGTLENLVKAGLQALLLVFQGYIPYFLGFHLNSQHLVSVSHSQGKPLAEKRFSHLGFGHHQG